jgi:hypothetical protein
MWRTVPGCGQDSRKFEVSPVSAINAASRVFATVELEGKTFEEVKDIIRFNPRPKYGYNSPFWPAEKGMKVFRFDCGSFGWQFNLSFDEQGGVTAVKRKWIH